MAQSGYLKLWVYDALLYLLCSIYPHAPALNIESSFSPLQLLCAREETPATPLSLVPIPFTVLPSPSCRVVPIVFNLSYAEY